MCGRETNTELPEEEKTQLKKLKWDEFLAITRRAIISKSILFILAFYIAKSVV